jgi:hypothetical protein
MIRICTHMLGRGTEFTEKNGPFPPDMNDGPAIERRTLPRHPAQRRVEWRSLADAAGPPSIATLNDISADGIGLVLQDWVAPGAALAVTVLDGNDDVGIFNLVRVKHSLPLGGKSWSVGGTFAEKISEEDLKSLLKQPSLFVPQEGPQVTGSPVADRSSKAGQTSRPNLAPTHRMNTATPAIAVSAATRTRMPEWRKRQLLEQIRERILHSKCAVEASIKS